LKLLKFETEYLIYSSNLYFNREEDHGSIDYKGAKNQTFIILDSVREHNRYYYHIFLIDSGKYATVVNNSGEIQKSDSVRLLYNENI